MTKVLFSGKTFNQDELKRVNVILQTQASRLWAEVRTYSFSYQKGRKKYLEGYTSASEATSDWSNDCLPNVNTAMTAVAANEQQSVVQNATNQAQQAQSDERADSSVTEKETVNTGSDMNEIIEGLPEESSTPALDPGWGTVDTDRLNESSQALQEAWAELDRATNEAQEAQSNLNDVQNASAGGGVATYVDENGVEHTYTNNGSTSTVTNYEYNGQTGTLTTGPDGTYFTPDGGDPQPLPSGSESATEVANAQAGATAENAQNAQEQANQNAQNAATENNNAQQAAVDEYNQQAREQYENERDPDDGNGGYSESDSSNWHSDDYDPSEWGGF